MANFSSMTISTSMYNFKTKQFFADFQYLPSVLSRIISQAEILIWFRICKPKTRCTCIKLRPALQISYWLLSNKMYVFVLSYGEKQVILCGMRVEISKICLWVACTGWLCERKANTRRNVLTTCLWVKGESFSENLYLRSISGSESKCNNWIYWKLHYGMCQFTIYLQAPTFSQGFIGN